MATTDLFARTTAFGLDGSPTWPYTWNGRDTAYATAADSLFYVDGSRVVIPVNDYDSYTIDWASPLSVGTAQFDFYIPVLSDNSHYRGPIILRLNPAGCPQPITLNVDDEWNWGSTYDPITDPHYRIGSANGDGQSYTTSATLPVEPGNMYTAKVGWNALGQSGYKLWKVGDPEPPDWLAVSVTGETSSYSDQWIDFWYDSDTEVAYLDNLSFDDADPNLPNGQFTLDALIAPALVCDDFARSTSYGLGTGPLGPYVFVPSTDPGVYVSTSATEAGASVSVNGSNVVENATSQRNVFRLPYPAALDGTLEFDFWVPASHGTNGQPIWLVRLDSLSRARGIGFEIDATPGSTSDYYIFRDYNGGSGITWTPASPGNWYTAKLIYGQNGAITVLVKPQGSDDSAAEATTSGTLGVDNQGYGDILVLDTEAFVSGDLLDNFCYRPIIPQLNFTIDAVLRRTQTGSFTADAVLSNPPVEGSFTADAVIRKTGQGGSFDLRAVIHKAETDVHIRVDGVDITDDVIFADAEFITLVNGAPGSFRFRVKDTTRTRSFRTGAEVTLDIDSVRRFGGYLMDPGRAFFFAVDDTGDITKVTRMLTLTGVDYNILFQKRVVRDKVTPTNVTLRSWPAGSHDDVVIKYVFDHYTDLGADGITYDKVEHIGSPNPDKTGVVGSGGLFFGDLMAEVNRLIGGIWYIAPDKDLTFTDVDTPNATKSLSDHPAGGTEIGFREFTHNSSAVKMANDALVWGAGIGVDKMKFGRTTDAPSVAAHKLWQYGEFTTSLYKQTSVNQRADSVVNGTPQSKRGGKDDQVSWYAATFDKSFVIGQKVTIESEVFGISDVVPIRRMRITFPTKLTPKFEMVLSHEIDEPWNMFEFFFPKLPVIHFPVISWPPPIVPSQGPCWTNPPEWLDDFNRTARDDPEYTSFGKYRWISTGGYAPHFSVSHPGTNAGPIYWPVVPDPGPLPMYLDGLLNLFLPQDYKTADGQLAVDLPIKTVRGHSTLEFDAYIAAATFIAPDGVLDGYGNNMDAILSISIDNHLGIEIGEETLIIEHPILPFGHEDIYTRFSYFNVDDIDPAPGDHDLWQGGPNAFSAGVHVKIESDKPTPTTRHVKATVGAVAFERTYDDDDSGETCPSRLSISMSITDGLRAFSTTPGDLAPYPMSEFYIRVDNLRVVTDDGDCCTVARAGQSAFTLDAVIVS